MSLRGGKLPTRFGVVAPQISRSPCSDWKWRGVRRGGNSLSFQFAASVPR